MDVLSLSGRGALVSVLMPAYNYGRFIGEALDSLISQTYQNWECLVVDDGSTDNTADVVKKYTDREPRIKYFYQQNSGVSAARNLAMRNASGEYFQLLDADDMLPPDKLEKHVQLFEANPDFDLIYSNALLFDDDGGERSYRTFQLPGTTPVSGRYDILIRHLEWDNFFLTPCVMFRKRMYDVVGEFETGLHGLEDWNYWYRSALKGHYFYNDKNENTRPIIRAHLTSSARNFKTMISGRMQARVLIAKEISLMLKKGHEGFAADILKEAKRKQLALMFKDNTRYAIQYDSNYSKWLKSIFLDAWYSRRIFSAIYDGAHWLKVNLQSGNSVVK